MGLDAQGMVMELLAKGSDRYVDQGAQNYIHREAGKVLGMYMGTGDSFQRYLVSGLEGSSTIRGRDIQKDVSDLTTGTYDLRQISGRLGQLANSGIDVASALYLSAQQPSRSYGSCYRC